MFRFTINSFLLFIIPAMISAQTSLKILNIDEEIRLDGKIDHAWESADSISQFTQLEPENGKRPPEARWSKLHRMSEIFISFSSAT